MKPVIFYHIPKTAGTSTIRMLETVIGSDRVWRHESVTDLSPLRKLVKAGSGLAAGHFYIKDIREQLRDFPHIGFAFLRNPLSHFCSNFGHFTNIVIADPVPADAAAPAPGEAVVPVALPASVMAPVETAFAARAADKGAGSTAAAPAIAPAAAPAITEHEARERLAESLHYANLGQDPAQGDVVAFQKACKEFGIAYALNDQSVLSTTLFDNPQTRFILRKHGPLTTADMEEAWCILDSLDCIGLSERFYDSMLAVCRLIGVDQRQATELADRRINTALDPDAALQQLGSSEIVSKIVERTSFDFELYRRAVKRYLRAESGASRRDKASPRSPAPRLAVPGGNATDLINLFRSNATTLVDAESAEFFQIDWDHIRLHPNGAGKPVVKVVSPLFNSHGRRLLSGTARVSHEHGPRAHFQISAIDAKGAEVCGIDVVAEPGRDADFTMLIPDIGSDFAIQLATRVAEGFSNSYGWADIRHLRLN